MTTTLAPTETRDRRPTAVRRVGYVVAAIVNGVLLWLVWQLLAWGWPAFLTEDFTQLRGVVTASLVAGIVTNVAFLFRDRGRFRGLADLVTNVLGLVVCLRTWTVFPFDFAGAATDWTWLVRTVLVLGIVGTSIGILISVGRALGVVSDDTP